MNTLALIIFLFGVTLAVRSNGQKPPQTIQQMQDNLNINLNSTIIPKVISTVISNVQKFNPVAVNAISYELAAATNTLNHYGLFSPLKEWIYFAFANLQGLVEVPDYVNDFISTNDINDQTDKAMRELNIAIENIYESAKAKPSCPKLISNMNDFTNTVSTNITNAINFLQNGFNADTSNELTLMSTTYSDFHNNITACSKLRPLPLCQTCMIDLVRK